MPLLTRNTTPSSWPKVAPSLTDEQVRIREDWVRYMLEHVIKQHGHIIRFNNEYGSRSARPGRTLEIGAGLGEHLPYEDLSMQEYHTVELYEHMAAVLRRDFPGVTTIAADCQQRLPYEDASFDRALAIHVLEHLPNLPAALDELKRLLKPGGVFSVVIPCEGGLGYGLGRRVTTKRAFERRYKMNYDWMVESEHVNKAREVLDELRLRFNLADTTFYPSRVPLIDLNILIGITCVRRAES